VTKPSDRQLDHTLHEVLSRRDPGAAPSELRTWVLDVPDGAHRSRASGWQRPLAAVLGVASVILLVVIGLTTLRNIEATDIAGATVPGGSPTSPSPTASPAAAFEPALEGPGISANDDPSLAVLVVIACGVLAALAMTIHGWRRLVPAVIAVVLAGWASVGSLVPVTVHDAGVAPGLNVVRAPDVPGSAEVLFYEVAPASGRFSMGLFLFGDSPVPLRIEGIVSPSFDHRDGFLGMLWTAVWIDEPNGGMTGPTRPFAPFDMARSGQAIWLVGRAGACALGSAFDPSNPATVLGFQSIDSLDVRVSVLGWPRTAHVALPFRLVEPDPQCPGPTPAPSG
jgi:hypothetical protein